MTRPSWPSREGLPSLAVVVVVPLVLVLWLAIGDSPGTGLVAAVFHVLVVAGVLTGSGSLFGVGVVALVVLWSVAAPGDVGDGAVAIGVGVVVVALAGARWEDRATQIERPVRSDRSMWILFDLAVGTTATVGLSQLVGDDDRGALAALVGISAMSAVAAVIYRLGERTPRAEVSGRRGRRARASAHGARDDHR